MRRSTRQRAEVDYSNTAATASTPTWLRPRGRDGKATRGSDEENRQPSSDDEATPQLKARGKGKQKDQDTGTLKSVKKPDRSKAGAVKNNAKGISRVQALKKQARKPLQEAVENNLKRASEERSEKQAKAVRQKSSGHQPTAPSRSGKGDDRRATQTNLSDGQHGKEKTDPGSVTTIRTRSQKRQISETDTASDSDARTSKRGKTVEANAAGSKVAKADRNVATKQKSDQNSQEADTAGVRNTNDSDSENPLEMLADPGKATSAPVNQKEKENAATHNAKGGKAEQVPDEVAAMHSDNHDSTNDAPAEQNIANVTATGNGDANPVDCQDQGDIHRKSQGPSKDSETQLRENSLPESTAKSEASSATFLELQAEYDSLQQKYEEIKSSHIADLENVITEVRSQEQAHTKKALQLASHWEAEAQRQAAIAQAGDVTQLQKQIEGLERQLSNLQEALIDQEALVLEKEEEIAALQKRLTSLIHLVETYEETLPSPLNDGEAIDTGPAATPATNDTQRPLKLNKLRGILQEALQSDGHHLAHTPAQALRARYADGRSGGTTRVSSIMAGSRMPSQLSNTRIQARCPPTAASQQGGRNLEVVTHPGTPKDIQNQEPGSKRHLSHAQNLLGLTYGTAAGTPIPAPQTIHSTQHVPIDPMTTPAPVIEDLSNKDVSLVGMKGSSSMILRSLPSIDRQRLQDPEDHSERPKIFSSGKVSQTVKSNRHGLLSEYASARADSCLKPKGPEASHVGRELAFTEAAMTSEAQVDSPQSSARPNGEDQSVHGPDLSGMAAKAFPSAEDVEPIDNTKGQIAASTAAENKENGGLEEASIAETTLGAISDLTNKGLMNLVGLTITARRGHGGFSYLHPPTGFVFEIRDDEVEAEDEQACLIFNPLDFGSAAELLPPYLKYEIKFAPEMRLKLVSRIMSHLGQSKCLED